MTARKPPPPGPGARYSSGLLAGLIFAGALSGCASQRPEAGENDALQHAVYDAVPQAWRNTADTTPDIDPLAISEELHEFIHATVKGKTSSRARMFTLTNAIFDPDGIGLVYDDDATHTAREAFESGNGNCMGFSNLLVAAAREAGLSANFELVSNFQNWQQQGDLLVRTLHVRVVSRIRDKKMVFDFYPQPINAGSWARPLSDSEAHAHHLNNLAATALQEGDYARAYGQLRKAIQISPHIGFIWSNLGALLSRRGLNSLAESAYKEASRIEPDLLTAVSNLQRLYARTGRAEEAGILEGRVQRYRERNPFYHFLLAEEAYADARYEEAVRRYRNAIRLKKDERDFYRGLSRSYYKLGKTIAARKAISKSHQIFEPESDTVLVRPSRR